MSDAKPNPGVGYVLCAADDPERTHYLNGSWYVRCPDVNCERCQREQTWRKPLLMPDGKRLEESEWELVPDHAKVLESDMCKATVGLSAWSHHAWAGSKAKEGEGIAVFARRKSPAPKAETGWVKCGERLPEQRDADKSGNVLAFSRVANTWCATSVEAVSNEFYSAWMKQPAPPEPEKSEAELAWGEFKDENGWHAFTSEDAFLAGYETGKAAR